VFLTPAALLLRRNNATRIVQERAMAQQLTRGAVGGADTTSAVESNPTVALLTHLRAALAALADAAVRGQGDRTAQRRSTEVVAVVLVERVADLGPVAAAAAIVAAAEDAR
jgi:tRNA(Ile2) C34 agmatinyltransferase TiaS